MHRENNGKKLSSSSLGWDAKHLGNKKFRNLKNQDEIKIYLRLREQPLWQWILR